MRRWAGWWLLLGLTPVWGQAPARLGVISAPPELIRLLPKPPGGALIYRVISQSAAGAAGLLPGDVIAKLNDDAIRDFNDLAERIQQIPSDREVRIEIVRNDAPLVKQVKLSSHVGALTPENYQATDAYLRQWLAKIDGVALRRELFNNLWEMGRRHQAASESAAAVDRFPQEASLKVTHLHQLRDAGRVEEFTTKAIEWSKNAPANVDLQMDAIDAMIARNELATAEQACQKVILANIGWPNFLRKPAVDAVQKWGVLRMRQGKPLTDPALARLNGIKLGSYPELAVFDWWRRQAGEEPTYQVSAPDGPVEKEFLAAKVLFGLAPQKMRGMTVQVNGVDVPLAIVDTGASHTMISTAQARDCNVIVGDTTRQAFGSMGFEARPGFIKELRIGSIIIRNVPVSVGNPPPLVMTQARMALGIDLMFCLRFLLDYEKDRIRVSPIQLPSTNVNQPWDIPLWPFAEHCIAEGRFADGRSARVLIDSGNFAQTLVWQPWAAGNLKNHPGVTDSMLLFAFRDVRRDIEGLQLGGRTLPTWAAIDMPPITLKGVDLIDLLMGNDLLAQYVTEIDLPNRRLRLSSHAGPPADPKPVKPFGF